MPLAAGNPVRAGFELLRGPLDRAFGHRHNPLDHLGALTIFACWIVLVSGLYLFVFFRTSVDGAYDSVEYLTRQQWYLGGVMRSLHRYASDLAIITMLLHLAKEFAYDRHREARWFSWVTGVPLLWLIVPLGITGYWLVWDELAEYVALKSAELIDWLPVFTDSMARNFLTASALSDRFFTLLAFLHLIALPLLLVFGLWLHLVRLNGPRINPPRALMVGTLVALLALSLAYPALSQGRADPSRVPESLGLDWYYLNVYPLLDELSPGWTWGVLVLTTALLLLAPWLPRTKARPVAAVDLDNCNGCRRCVDDCPFAAVTLGPRSDGKAFAAEAVVDPALCLSCGICVGACPTATPFRTRTQLDPGIDLPGASAAALRDRINELGAGSDRPVIVVACRDSDAGVRLQAAGESVLEVECAAHLPPSFVDYALARGLAGGVFFSGCPGGDCHYRAGANWAELRIARRRDPRLRERVEDRRVALGWLAPWRRLAPEAAVAAFRRSVGGEPPAARAGSRLARGVAVVLAAGLLMAVTGWLSMAPRVRLLEPDAALVSLSFSHAGQRLGECRTLSAEELSALPPNMRNPQECPRERRPLRVEFRVDGETRYRASLPASGLWRDGEATVYRRVPVAAGQRRLFVGLSDSDRVAGFDYEREVEIDIDAGRHLVIGFDADGKEFLFQ